MRIEEELKTQLARELCAILGDTSILDAAEYLGTYESEISRLRHGHLHRFSVTRLLRLITDCGYVIEVTLRPRPVPQPNKSPLPRATASVVRHDRFGRAV